MSISRPPEARLSVGVLGAGRVGSVLGAALRNAGHEVRAVSAVSTPRCAAPSSLLPDVPVVPADEVPRGANLVLLTVPDDALADLVTGLVATGALAPGQLVAHTSGLHGLAVLEPATRAGCLPLALHPVLPFSGTEVDVARLTGASFGVTSPEPLRPVAEALVVEMGGEPVWITDELRPLWHAALAHGSNHLVTLVASAADLLRAAGVESPAGSSRRCSARRWTARSAPATPCSPARSRAATPAPSVRTSTSSSESPPRSCRRTSRWPGSPPTARSPAAGSTRTTPARCSRSSGR